MTERSGASSLTARPGAPAESSTAAALAIARAAGGLRLEVGELSPRTQRAVELATRLGAPVVPVLEVAQVVETHERDLRWAVDRASAEGRAVARSLVVAPPVLGPVTALLVTDAPFAVWGTALGRVVLALALVLWLTGSLVVRVVVRRAREPRGDGTDAPCDEMLDLAAVAVSSGVGLATALREAAVVDPHGGHGSSAFATWLELGARGAPPPPWGALGPGLAAARQDGLAIGPVLRAVATAQREERHQVALERAAGLGARLTLPTTLLLLPSALLLVGAPVVHGALAWVV